MDKLSRGVFGDEIPNFANHVEMEEGLLADIFHLISHA